MLPMPPLKERWRCHWCGIDCARAQQITETLLEGLTVAGGYHDPDITGVRGR